MRVCFLAIALALMPMTARADVLTRRNDNTRSGVNAQETLLTHNTVRTRFGKLWTLYADAKIMAQPLYVSNLKVAAANLQALNGGPNGRGSISKHSAKAPASSAIH